MSLKCTSCGLVNYNDAAFCKRCGASLASASADKQTAYRSSQSQVDASVTKIGPSLIFMGACLILISLILGIVQIGHHFRTARCTASTQGLLSPKYTVETTVHTLTQLEIPYGEH